MKMKPSEFSAWVNGNDETPKKPNNMKSTLLFPIERAIPATTANRTSLRRNPSSNTFFQQIPEDITFKGYKPNETYEFVVALRNDDKVSDVYPVKILNSQTAHTLDFLPVETSIFSVIPKMAPKKIAPGMEATFVIKFSPDSTRDYSADIKFLEDQNREFLVSVKTIGNRGYIDIPDIITFPTGAIKCPNTRTILVRNIGNRECRFKMVATTPLIQIYPPNAVLGVDQKMQIALSYTAQTTEEFSAQLFVEYETGETVCTKIIGDAREATISVETNEVEFPPTFVGRSITKIIKLKNDSDHKVFQPKKAFRI
jgi:hydrocephalus-inducing protein